MSAWQDAGPETYIDRYAVKDQRKYAPNGVIETRLLVRDLLNGSPFIAVQLPEVGRYEPS